MHFKRDEVVEGPEALHTLVSLRSQIATYYLSSRTIRLNTKAEDTLPTRVFPRIFVAVMRPRLLARS